MAEFGFDSLMNYLLLGAALTGLGTLGFLARRNLIVMFLSAEMMLQGIALTFVGFGRFHGNWNGQVFTILILTVAACEAGIALALILLLFSRRPSLDVSAWRDVREESAPPPADDPEEIEPPRVTAGPETYPQLTPAGVEPGHPGRAWEIRRD